MCGDLLGSAGRTGRTRSLPGFFCLYSCHRSLRVTCFLASLLRICSNGDIPLPSTSRGKGKGAYRCPSRYAKSPLSFSLTASYSPLVFLAVFGAKPTMALTFLACLSGSFGGGRIHHNRWPVWIISGGRIQSYSVAGLGRNTQMSFLRDHSGSFLGCHCQPYYCEVLQLL